MRIRIWATMTSRAVSDCRSLGSVVYGCRRAEALMKLYLGIIEYTFGLIKSGHLFGWLLNVKRVSTVAYLV